MYTDLQTQVLFYPQFLLTKIVQIVVLTFFLDFTITFDSDTLKKPTVPHLKIFFTINKFGFMYKKVSFCIISMLKSGKFGELQNFVSDFSCILGRI